MMMRIIAYLAMSDDKWGETEIFKKKKNFKNFPLIRYLIGFKIYAYRG